MSDIHCDVTGENALAHILCAIQDFALDYPVRNRLVLCALGAAAANGLPCGVRIDPGSPEWPVAFITLPTGQISFHLPAFPDAWDGHDTPEKYRRCDAYVRSILSGGTDAEASV